LKFSEQIFLYADSGYQGLKEYHKNSFLPTKKPKNGELSKKEKRENCRISKIRILVENVLALVKNFRIISGICRYRLNKIAKRFNLICGICNLKNV
jgi:hypothetical protein